MSAYLTIVKEVATMHSNIEITSKPKSLNEYGLERSLGAECVSFQPIVDEKKVCSFFLLGPFAITDAQGKVITPKAQKTCAMLAMLILSPRATRTRVWIRDKLWSDRGEGQGAASLRQSLLDARRALGDLGGDIIIADKKCISLDLSKINTDFERLMLPASESGFGREAFERALNEDLLEGMDIRDPEFEDWLTLERQVWQRRVNQQLEHRVWPRDDDSKAPEQVAKVLPITSQLKHSPNPGQKLVVTTMAIRLGSAKNEVGPAFFNDCVAVIRDDAVDKGGRIFDLHKHHVLMEFERPYDAVRFAMNLTGKLSDTLTADSDFGIGINSGLVYRDKVQVYGTECDISVEASNISQGQAVLITEALAAQVQGKVDYQFVFDKECSVTNLSEPVRLFSVSHATAATGIQDSFNQAMDVDIEGHGPSIGVLPFRVSDASVDEYMCEGLADDIIVALSNNHWLNVISRNSSFSYEYQAGSSKAAAKDLRVNYILGGSVRVSKSILTIVVTLESVATNRIIWSEPFSVKITEIMQLQERIATEITAHLLQELGKHEQVRAYESRIDDLTTWQLVHRGHWHMARRTSTGVARARKLYERALERDEYQSEALVALAWWYFWKAWSEHGIKQTDRDLEESTRLCRKALLMDRSDGRVHAYLGAIAIMRNQAAAAIVFFDEAIRLNPSLSFAYSSRGSANLYLCKPELAPSDIRNALALNPADYYRFHSLAELAAAYYFSSELDKSIEAAESSSFLAPRYWYARLIKIACLVARNNDGDRQRAAQEKEEIISRKVNVSETNIRAIPFVNSEYNERLIKAYKEV
jgi:TolB-like protein